MKKRTLSKNEQAKDLALKLKVKLFLLESYFEAAKEQLEEIQSLLKQNNLVMAKTLTDQDPIDFGKYEGTPLIDVPGEYLLYCYRQGTITPSVKNYVRYNMDVLLFEERENEKKNRPNYFNQ